MCYMKYACVIHVNVVEQQSTTNIIVCYIKYDHVLHEDVDEQHPMTIF
jgi:hypothetical protein